MPSPDYSRIPAWYHRYIDTVAEADLLTALNQQAVSFPAFLESIPDGKTNYRYAEGKWSIREILQHILDAERVFAYRALCFARKDPTPLPGFDENSYAEHSNAGNRRWNDMIEEFNVIRKSTILLFSSFNTEQLEHSGVASGNPVYVGGIGFIIAGHVNHHRQVITNKYLQ